MQGYTSLNLNLQRIIAVAAPDLLCQRRQQERSQAHCTDICRRLIISGRVLSPCRCVLHDRAVAADAAAATANSCRIKPHLRHGQHCGQAYMAYRATPAADDHAVLAKCFAYTYMLQGLAWQMEQVTKLTQTEYQVLWHAGFSASDPSTSWATPAGCRLMLPLPAAHAGQTAFQRMHACH